MLSSCILAQSDTTLFSAADVPCGREGESNHAVPQHHNDRDILLQRDSDGSPNILIRKRWKRCVGRYELILVHIARIQCLVRC